MNLHLFTEFNDLDSNSHIQDTSLILILMAFYEYIH